jgi:hypothetical protein
MLQLINGNFKIIVDLVLLALQVLLVLLLILDPLAPQVLLAPLLDPLALQVLLVLLLILVRQAPPVILELSDLQACPDLQ